MPYKNKEDLYKAQKRFRDKRKMAMEELKALRQQVLWLQTQLARAIEQGFEMEEVKTE